VGIEGGALIVAASGAPWASQVSFLAAEIARRANTQLGSSDIQTVRVIVRSEAGKSLRDRRFGGPGDAEPFREQGPSDDRI
jgi:hypothetical protein